MILTYAPEGKVMAVIEGNEPSVKHFQETTGLAIKFGGLQTLFSSGHKDQDAQKDLPPAPTGDMQSFTRPEPDKRGFALVIQTAPDTFIVAGSNVLLTNSDRLLGTIDEGSFRKLSGCRVVVSMETRSRHVTPYTPGAARRCNAWKLSRSRSIVRWWSKAVNLSCFLSVAAFRTPRNPWDMRFPRCVGDMWHWTMFFVSLPLWDL
jgi:hypothetical protein